MNRSDQRRIIGELCASVVRYMLELVRDHKIPEDWDGHELRAMFADKAAEAASISRIRNSPRSARARSYRNHVKVNCL